MFETLDDFPLRDNDVFLCAYQANDIVKPRANADIPPLEPIS